MRPGGVKLLIHIASGFGTLDESGRQRNPLSLTVCLDHALLPGKSTRVAGMVTHVSSVGVHWRFVTTAAYVVVKPHSMYSKSSFAKIAPTDIRFVRIATGWELGQGSVALIEGSCCRSEPTIRAANASSCRALQGFRSEGPSTTSRGLDCLSGFAACRHGCWRRVRDRRRLNSGSEPGDRCHDLSMIFLDACKVDFSLEGGGRQSRPTHHLV